MQLVVHIAVVVTAFPLMTAYADVGDSVAGNGRRLSAAQIQTAVEQLSSSTFQQREQATELLIHGGQQVIPMVQKATNSNDLEARTRALGILAILLNSKDDGTSTAAKQALTAIGAIPVSAR